MQLAIPAVRIQPLWALPAVSHHARDVEERNTCSSMYGHTVHVKRFMDGETRTEPPQLTSGSGPPSARGIIARTRRNAGFDLGIGAEKADWIAGHKGRYAVLSGGEKNRGTNKPEKLFLRSGP